jgi:hypothetical protein
MVSTSRRARCRVWPGQMAFTVIHPRRWRSDSCPPAAGPRSLPTDRLPSDQLARSSSAASGYRRAAAARRQSASLRPGQQEPARLCLPPIQAHLLPRPGPGPRARPQARGPAGRRPSRIWARSPFPAAAGCIRDPAAIGLCDGKVLNKRKMAKHITLDIAEGRISWQRHTASINAEALTDRIYVIRTRYRRKPSTRRRRLLQAAGQPRARLPLHQSRRPGPAPHHPFDNALIGRSRQRGREVAAGPKKQP